MPLTRRQRLDDCTWLGIWKMDEPLESLKETCRIDWARYKSGKRQREALTAHLLLSVLSGRDDLVINHMDDGAPIVDGYNISISHTMGWLAIVLSKGKRIGVDIEYCSDKVDHVAARFIREDEQNSSRNERLINWCAKEATYKYFHEQDLTFHEMRLLHYRQGEKGKAHMLNIRLGMEVEINYEVNDQFALAYIF